MSLACPWLNSGSKNKKYHFFHNDVRKFLEPTSLTNRWRSRNSSLISMLIIHYNVFSLTSWYTTDFNTTAHKHVLGIIDMYSRYAVCRPLTNMRMPTIMENLKEIFAELGGFPENVNCDNQFDVPELTDFFTKKGTKIWFSQTEQPHKNTIIERFWRLLLCCFREWEKEQRTLTGWKLFLMLWITITTRITSH